jgi:ribosomal-protein-alanine N-acetyltransferase
MRPFAHEDVDVLYRMWTDSDVRRYLWDDKIIERERAAGEVEDSIASFEKNGFGMWVVLLAGATEVSGFGGFRLFGAPPTKKELMYGIAPPLWGRGYATEIAEALLRFGFERLGEERIWARTDPPNVGEREGEIEVVTYVKEKSSVGAAASDRSAG